jgi:hypothetical protein
LIFTVLDGLAVWEPGFDGRDWTEGERPDSMGEVDFRHGW